MNADPASLEHLHDIALPPPVPWWSPAPGWHVLGALALLLLAWLAWNGYGNWRRNTYRRAALRRLAAIPADDISALAELVRRSALSVFPRGKIVPPMGAEWAKFLNAALPAEPKPHWHWLRDTYRLHGRPRAKAWQEVDYWLRHHRAPARKEEAC